MSIEKIRWYLPIPPSIIIIIEQVKRFEENTQLANEHVKEQRELANEHELEYKELANEQEKKQKEKTFVLTKGHVN